MKVGNRTDQQQGCNPIIFFPSFSGYLENLFIGRYRYGQCCEAEPFFLGSGSRYFFSAPAPTDFDTKYLKNLNFNFKKASINLDFVPKRGKIYLLSLKNFI